MKSAEEIQASIEAQKKLCEEKGLPHFAPSSGICWSCSRQIYLWLDGHSFITGCPACHRSYCD